MSIEKIKKNFLDYFNDFVKKNFKSVVILLFAGFVFFSIFLFYKNSIDKNNIKISEKYTQASILIKQKKIKESKSILVSIINKDHKFYSPLALYLIIDNNIENDYSKIIIFFNKVLKNKSINKENINLIKIKKAIYLINIDKEKLIIETLNPVINSDSVWKNMAINLITEYFLSKEQKVKAQEYFQLLNKEQSK